MNQGFETPPVDALAEAAVQRVREDMGLADDVKLSCRTRLKTSNVSLRCVCVSFPPCLSFPGGTQETEVVH